MMTMSLKLPPVRKMHNYSWVVALTIEDRKMVEPPRQPKDPKVREDQEPFLSRGKGDQRKRVRLRLPESMKRWPKEKGKASPKCLLGEPFGPYQIEFGGWRVTCHGWTLYTCIVLSSWRLLRLISLYSPVRMVDVQWGHFCSNKDSEYCCIPFFRTKKSLRVGEMLEGPIGSLVIIS